MYPVNNGYFYWLILIPSSQFNAFTIQWWKDRSWRELICYFHLLFHHCHHFSFISSFISIIVITFKQNRSSPDDQAYSNHGNNMRHIQVFKAFVWKLDRSYLIIFNFISIFRNQDFNQPSIFALIASWIFPQYSFGILHFLHHSISMLIGRVILIDNHAFFVTDRFISFFLVLYPYHIGNGANAFA